MEWLRKIDEQARALNVRCVQDIVARTQSDGHAWNNLAMDIVVTFEQCIPLMDKSAQQAVVDALADDVPVLAAIVDGDTLSDALDRQLPIARVLYAFRDLCDHEDIE